MRTWRQRGERAILKYGTLAEAFLALGFSRLGMLVCFPLLARWALRRTHAPAEVHPHLEQRIRWAIGTAALWMPGDKDCLPNAIAAKGMLARRGVPSTIHLGVGRHAGGALHAHAWLEAGGAVITGVGEHLRVTRIIR